MAQEPLKFNEEGQAWWRSNFKPEEKVDIKLFSAALVGMLDPRPKVEHVELVAKYVIDTTDNDGKISSKEWDFFVLRFGPPKSSVAKCLANLFDRNFVLAPWFWGGTSREASEKSLDEDGKYLMRFSERFPANLTFAFNKPEKPGKSPLGHLLIQNHPDGFSLPANPNVVFKNLSEVIKAKQVTKFATSPLYQKLSLEGIFPPAEKFENRSKDEHKYANLSDIAHPQDHHQDTAYRSFDEINAGKHHTTGSNYASFDSLAGAQPHGTPASASSAYSSAFEVAATGPAPKGGYAAFQADDEPVKPAPGAPAAPAPSGGYTAYVE